MVSSVNLTILQGLYSEAHKQEWLEERNRIKAAEEAAEKEMKVLFNLCKDAATKGGKCIRVRPEDVSQVARRLLTEAGLICDTISFTDGTFMQISGWEIKPQF